MGSIGHHSLPPTLPDRQRAVVQAESPAGKLQIVTDRPVPKPAFDEVLVRVHAVAVNPSDWKMTTQFPCPGAGCGMDFSGVVVATGHGLDPALGIRVGDAVAGAVHGANPFDPQAGAFAEYTCALADLLWKIPRPWDLTDAATVGGCCVATVGLGLFADDALGLPFGLDQFVADGKASFVLVYGGSTASGTMAIQLAKLCGYRVIATCSPRNAAMVESYGAERTFDYSSSSCAADIRAYTENTLHHVLDTIVDPKSILVANKAIGRSGGRYAGLEALPEDVLDGSGTTRRIIKWTYVMGTSMIGREEGLTGPYYSKPRPERRAFGKWWFRTVVQDLVDKGLLRPHPVKLMEGGLERVPEGVEMLQKKLVSGEKLVYKVV
ncbi:Putative GroES-like superfamily, alcohol dehydrogenase-like, NAD(P)-binding domain superfamily [Colletotrichum destructivum]|uniref:GroES-like superfamily, alcohol dehydrogenase-like, NAD(P)-binding domain superfamily n=1 Tax=Colletotrichum destructivum TaxID=34406 RepID=A0AAX4I537_9PEZI|nr:Putative GroES-like superfamily, alcohol dehydrogenase-like, NAD(P)-binding domain superfamily [Colletotrichum destructivum]